MEFEQRCNRDVDSMWYSFVIQFALCYIKEKALLCFGLIIRYKKKIDETSTKLVVKWPWIASNDSRGDNLLATVIWNGKYFPESVSISLLRFFNLDNWVCELHSSKLRLLPSRMEVEERIEESLLSWNVQVYIFIFCYSKAHLAAPLWISCSLSAVEVRPGED